MPSIAQVEYEPVCGKKRRWEDNGSESGSNLKITSPRSIYSPQSTDQLSTSPSIDRQPFFSPTNTFERRKIHPKPIRIHNELTKRQRIERPTLSTAYTFPLNPSRERQRAASQLDSSNTLYSTLPTLSQLQQHQAGNLHLEQEQQQQQPRITKADLRPCHICRRKPTSKHELNSFADCEACEERTCWICIRECFGHDIDSSVSNDTHPHGSGSGSGSGAGGCDMELSMDDDDGNYDGLGRRRERGSNDGFSYEDLVRMGKGREVDVDMEEGREQHKSMICSRCCVERGSEGEVWCFGCLKIDDI